MTTRQQLPGFGRTPGFGRALDTALDSPAADAARPQAAEGRLAWPLAVAAIGGLSLLAWMAVGYLVHWMFPG